jgi:hypothetical protein
MRRHVVCASLKATTLLFLTHDAFVVCASMMPEPRRRGHMATVTPRSVGSLSFSGWQEHLRPLLTRDPAVYATRQNLTLCQRAPRLILAPLRRQLHDLLLRSHECCLHPLGSTSWCTRYGFARKWTYSNQPIFLFPEQNGRRFD